VCSYSSKNVDIEDPNNRKYSAITIKISLGNCNTEIKNSGHYFVEKQRKFSIKD